MIVDAHHHFWDPAVADYAFLTDELAEIRRAFGPDDLSPLLTETGVDRTILVQTRSSEDETVPSSRPPPERPSSPASSAGSI